MFKEGVKEDISDVILNLKGLQYQDGSPAVAEHNGLPRGQRPRRSARRSQIELNKDIEILNPDQLIATLSA